MGHTIYSRNNFFDGQEINEEDMDLEQTAWHGTLADDINFLAGSGVEKEYTTQKVLFDTSDVPTSVSTLITTESFDGEPLYEEDSFGNTIFLQPTDTTQGNQLEVEISGASLDGSATLKVYLFGTTFDDEFEEEVLTFDSNGSRITRRYFTSIVAIMTQDFRGNQNTLITGTACRNAGGRLRVLEALPMAVARDTIMVEQAREPNQDYVSFKPATLFKTLDTVLDDIATEAGKDKDDLGINVTSTTTRQLEVNETGVIIAQKFKATTSNIQKVTILLSVEERTLVPENVKFDWSGDIVVGIRELQTSTSCPTDIIPDAQIDFDPEPSPIAEVSFSKAELADVGVVLTDSPQKVDFVFTQSLLANPNLSPSLTVGNYYALTIRRAGNISTGDIILEVAANTTPSTETDEMRMTVFSQNKWTDIEENDLWFQIHTDAVRIVDGTAIDAGVAITSPKVKENAVTGVNEAYVEGNHSFVTVSSNDYNYVIVQKSNEFSDVESHPSTGNSVFTRINDAPEVSVVSESTLTTLIGAGNKPVVLAAARDTNPVELDTITGYTLYPGLAGTNTFTLIAPSSDVTANNLVGSILTPNVDEGDLQYRIIRADGYTDAYGDINGDGSIDADDVTRCLELGDIVSGDGYSKDLASGSLSSASQVAAFLAGAFTMDEILRADVNDTGVITTEDAAAIQQYISLGTAFPAGSTFTRVVLTVENVTNPLTTSADILGNDSAFNTVPFSSIQYRIEFISLWSESNVEITDLRRFIPKTFSDITSSNITATTKSGGSNTFFVPDDLILTGDLLDEDSNPKKIDLEVTTITITLPEGDTIGEIDIFNNYIKNTMYFSDGTLVGSSALSNSQVKVSTAISSTYKTDGYVAGLENVSILYTQSSGLLRINATGIQNLVTSAEKKTRIVLTVFLKKAGFRNSDVELSTDDVNDLLIPP